MKVFQSQFEFLRNDTVHIAKLTGYPTDIYPNSDTYAYHDFYELELFIDGEGLHHLNGIPYEVKPGYLYLLFPGDYHRMQLHPEHPFELFNLQFSIDISAPALMSEISTYPNPYCIYLSPDTQKILEQELQLLHDCYHLKKYDERMMRNAIERICILLLYQLQDDSITKSAPIDHRIWKITDYIEKNYARDITFHDIAAVADIAETYLGSFFKKHTGHRLIEYINQRRLHHALQLLGSTGMTVQEVAYHTGFCSPEYMARTFKTHGFQSPKTYQLKSRS